MIMRRMGAVTPPPVVADPPPPDPSDLPPVPELAACGPPRLHFRGFR